MSDTQPDVWGPAQPGDLPGFLRVLAEIVARALQEEAQAQQQGAVQYSPGQATGEESAMTSYETGIPIRYSFEVVDSGAWTYFLSPGGHFSAYTARRASYASGLVQYVLSTPNGEIGGIQFRSYGPNLTMAWALLNMHLADSKHAHQVEDAIRAEIWRFREWLESDVSQTTQWVAEIEDMTAVWAAKTIAELTGAPTAAEINSQIPRPRGRPIKPINERVRQRLDAGDPIDQIRDEYLAHQNPKNEADRKLALDRFRKLIKDWERNK